MDNFETDVSVIVPTFNSANYIERCLDSLLNQSLKRIEIIAVDDGSNDKTLSILGEYSKSYKNIKIFQTPKRSMAGGARNVGVDVAKGKFISFIDSDDWIDTNYYKYMVESIEESGCDLALCSVKREWENSKSSSYRYQYNHSNIISGQYALSLLSNTLDQDISISAIVTNKLYRTSFIRKNNLFFLENSFNEDDLFTFIALLKCQRVCITSQTHYHLFQRPGSASRGVTEKHISDLFDAFERIKKLLKDECIYEDYKLIYYSFFEKCFCYLLESLNRAVPNESEKNNFIKVAYRLGNNVIDPIEFIDYCGNKRINEFFL